MNLTDFLDEQNLISAGGYFIKNSLGRALSARGEFRVSNLLSLTKALLLEKTNILSRNSVQVGLVNLLLSDPDFIADDFVKDGQFIDKRVVLENYELFDEFSTDLIAAFEDLSEEVSGVKYLTITNSDGAMFKLMLNPNIDIHGDQHAIICPMLYFADHQQWIADEPIIYLNYTLKNITIRQDVRDYLGKHYCLWDIVDDLGFNIEVNEGWVELVDMITSNAESFKSEMIQTSKWMKSKRDEIRDIADQVAQAYRASGIFGIITYLINFRARITTLSADEEGYLDFTDPATFTPATCLSGIIKAGLQIASGVATIIATVVTPALGACVAVISSLVSGLISLVDTAILSTQASLVDDGTASLDVAPYAFLKGEEAYSAVASLLPESFGLGEYYVISVPGGYLFFFLKDADTVGVEFHPDLTSRFDFFRALLDNIINLDTVGQSHLTIDTTWLDSDYVDWDAIPDDVQVFNTADGVTNINVGHVCLINMLIFWLFCHRITNPGYYSVTYEVQLSGSVPGTDQWEIVFSGEPAGYEDANVILGYLCYFGFTPNEMRPACPPEAVWNYPDDYFSTGWYAAAAKLATRSEFKLGSAPTPWWSIMDNVPITGFFNTNDWYGLGMFLAGNIVYGVRLPKMEASTALAVGGIVAGVTAAIVATSVFIGSKIHKAIRRKRLTNAAKVEKAQQDMVNNPTNANADAYSLAKLKNNVWADFIGGSKFSKLGYWASTDQDTAISKVYQRTKSLFKQVDTESPTDVIIRLIKG